MDFRSLQHMQEPEIHFGAGFACPLGCTFRVWLPSWRLTPSGSGPVLFHTGSAHGIHPSELSPLEKASEPFPPQTNPLAVLICEYSRCRSNKPALQTRDSWVLTLARVPSRNACV